MAVFSYKSGQGSGENFTHRATEKGKKGRKKRGEVARRGRLVEGQGVRGRANQATNQEHEIGWQLVAVDQLAVDSWRWIRRVI